MSKPYLAFSELTQRVYIVHAKGKEDVTDWICKYAELYAESKASEDWGRACERKIDKQRVTGNCFCGKPAVVHAFDTNFCQKHNDELAKKIFESRMRDAQQI